MKLYFKYLLILIPVICFSQNKNTIYKVNYDQLNNGKKNKNTISINFQNQIVFLSKSDSKIKQYIDFNQKENSSTIFFENQLYKEVIAFSELPKPKFADKPEKILGFKCKYASYSYFSNTIEVWYTEKTKAKGSPYSRFVPSSDALVLKIRINGGREIIASSIEKIKGAALISYPVDEAKKVSKAEFEELKINSRYTKLEIFKDATINFDTSIKPPKEKTLLANHVYHFSLGSVLMKKIKLSSELRNSGSIFAKLTCKSNGDAYDRTGSVFIVPINDKLSVLDAYHFGLDTLPVYTDNLKNEYQGIQKKDNYDPPIEILRFFTSFGADHFNEKRKINNYNWANNVTFKQEITPLVPSETEEFWVGVFIGNYDKGGHKISLEFNFYPSYNKDKKKKDIKYIQPLFSTINTLEMSGQNYGKLFKNDTLSVDFEVNENIENLQLLYTSTGHGGWGGGDEFNPKLNKIFIDGKEVFKIVPWRTDCATYRLLNPASGNFGNGLSSSDLSRSNWCPGTLTPPYIIPLTDLKPGKHVIEIVIEQGDDDGSSFNHWGLSGILTGQIIPSKND